MALANGVLDMIHEFKNPIPVVTDIGSGYAIYVRDGGTFENDIWCVVLEDGGRVLHFRSDQIRVYANATFDIAPDGIQKPSLKQSMDKVNERYQNALRKLAESEASDGLHKPTED